MQFLIALLTLVSLAFANDWATYPQVPKTASINGFADPIYGKLPSCARECVKFSTSNTPCPYWDTGCFCVMPQWSGLVGQCVAKNCAGDDVSSATSLATSLCASVGANTWMMPASISTQLSKAANAKAASATFTSEGSSASLGSSAQVSSSARTTDSASSGSSTSAVSSTKSSADSSRSTSTGTSSSSKTESASSSSTANDAITKSRTGALAVLIGTVVSLFF